MPEPVRDNDMPTVSLDQSTDSDPVLSITGRLDAATLPSIWATAVDRVRADAPPRLTVDLEGVTYCDGSGIGLLVELDSIVRIGGGAVSFIGVGDELERILDMALLKDPKSAREPRSLRLGIVEQVGRATADVLNDVIDLVAWTGELTMALIWAALNPHRVRWRDTWAIAEKVGADATPVVCLLGFIIGLIMAFQSAAPLAQFGAESLIPTVVGFSIIRELGPLITAIILAGRSGSAFAAEIGTMKVTEELDALTTFGLSPTRFLVVPRMIAALLMTPLLSVFCSLMGIAGGYVVMAGLGYSLAFYVDQITGSIDYIDFLQGVAKTVVFAWLIAAIGCLRGLKTKSGPGAVGDSTTGAVVAGIVMIVIADGILGVVFFYAGI